MRILAIDLGSTEFKAGIFDEDGIAATSAQPVPYTDAACSRLCAEDVAAAWRKLLAPLVAKNPPERIAITSQAQTFSLAKDGEKLTEPFWSWRHSSPAEVINRSKAHFAEMEFSRHVSFSEPVPGMALVILRELREAGLLHPASRPIFLPEYLVKLLTGKSVQDSNQAAMTGLYSQVEHHWWLPAWEWCGMTPENAAQVIMPGGIAGQTIDCDAFGLPDGIPVILAGNDQSAGAFGSGIVPGEVFLSLGTAFAAYARLKCHKAIPGGASGEFYDEGYYALKTAPQGGDALERLVAECAGGDFDAFFSGSGSENPSFIKLMEKTANTVLELNEHPTALAVAGGASRARSVTATLERMLGLPVRRCNASPLSGAALIASSKACR